MDRMLRQLADNANEYGCQFPRPLLIYNVLTNPLSLLDLGYSSWLESNARSTNDRLLFPHY